MFWFNIKTWSMFAMLNYVCSRTIVIEHLNKIWNFFQNSFHLGQEFISQYYLKIDETFFLIHLEWWILFWSFKYLHVVHATPNVCPFVTSIKINVIWSKHNILYIRWRSDLKFKDHLHNRHTSLSINIADLFI